MQYFETNYHSNGREIQQNNKTQHAGYEFTLYIVLQEHGLVPSSLCFQQVLQHLSFLGLCFPLGQTEL